MQIVRMAAKSAPQAVVADSSVASSGTAFNVSDVAHAAARHQPPRWSVALVHRHALLRQMVVQPGQALLLTGPLGSGKTTLLACHFHRLREQGTPVRWLSLGPEHNDCALLREHLCSAFQGQVLGADERPQIEEGVVAFLDGLEHLSHPAAFAMAVSLVSSIPATSRLYMSAHCVGGAVLHDAMLRGVLRRLGAEDLRMSDEEASEVLGSAISPVDAQQLNRRVQGWAAGLRLLASVPEQSMRWLRAGALDGTVPMPLAEYYAQVVCAAMSAETLRQMMELAVIERFTAEMLSSMPQPPCRWTDVDALLQSQHFIDYAPRSRDWVLMQPAFAQYLARRLRALDPARHDALQQCAAQWCLDQRWAAEAVAHAVRLRDRELAQRIIEQAGAISVDLGNGPDVSLPTWLPASRAGELPLLFFGQIYHRVRHGHYQEARQAFDVACQLTDHFRVISPDADRAQVDGWLHILEIVFCSHDDRPAPDALIEALEQDLALHMEPQPVLAAAAASVLAFGHLDASRYSQAALTCRKGLHALGADKDSKVSIFLRLHQASVALAKDSLDQALLCAQEARRVAMFECAQDSYEFASAQLLCGVLHYENDELTQAWQLLAPTLDRVRTINGWVRLYAEAFSVAAATANAMHGLELAETVIDAGLDFAHERGFVRLSRFMAIARARERLRAGEHKGALEVVESAIFQEILSDPNPQSFTLVQQVPARLVAAKLMLALGRLRDAMAQLDAVDKAFLEEADQRLSLEYSVLAMQTSQGLRRYNAAREHLIAAVDVARRAGLVRRVAEVQAQLVSVADATVRRGQTLPARISRWIEERVRPALRTSAAQPTGARPRRPDADLRNYALSPRETEILSLVAEGYANKEVGARLGISEGTVKSHRKSVYEKLGVNSRSQAIQRARELLII